MPLIDSIIENGVYHYSDKDTLYFPANTKTRALVGNLEGVKEFYCEKSGRNWFEVKGGDPRFWEKKIDKIKENVDSLV